MVKLLFSIREHFGNRNQLFIAEAATEGEAFRKAREHFKEHFVGDLRTFKHLGEIGKTETDGVLFVDPTNNVGGYDLAVVKESA